MTGGAATGFALSRLGMASARQTTPNLATHHDVFFGWVLGVSGLMSVAIDASEPNASGTREIVAYVCDGLRQGVARWFSGSMAFGETTTISAPGSDEIITISTVRDELAAGDFVGSDGIAHPFVTMAAMDGAGIFEVTIDDVLNVAGSSTHGSILAAHASSNHSLTGTITTADGTEIALANRSMTLLPAEAHAVNGLQAVYDVFENASIDSKRCIALIFPEGPFWFGLSDDVHTGAHGGNSFE
jgi:hypothetical protein